MSAAEESAQRREWEQSVIRRTFALADAREEVEARAEEAERRAKLEAKHDPDVELFRQAMTGEPPRTLGSILHDHAVRPDPPDRDPSAALGSRLNPVPLYGGPPAVQRSRESETDRLLARAKAVDTPFMRDQIRRYHERGAYGREISR